jgi:prepilin-type N-terminal cleavage/methylation domain-containing protein
VVSARTATGFTLVEMLVAAAITLTITGAVFHLIDPADGAFRAQPEAADLQQRLRTVVRCISRSNVLLNRSLL